MTKFNLSSIFGLFRKRKETYTSPTFNPPCLEYGYWTEPLAVNKTSDTLRNTIAILSSLGLVVNRHYYIAGGSVRLAYQDRPLDGHDIDVFFKNDGSYQDAKKHFDKELDVVCNTNRAVTYRSESGLTLQLINKKFHSKVEFLLGSFDFTVCQFATDGHYVYGSYAAFDDLKSNTLRYAPNYRLPQDGSEVVRLTKYVLYGFKPIDGMMTNIMSTAVKNNFSYISLGVGSNRVQYFRASDNSFYDSDSQLGTDNKIEQYESFDYVDADTLDFVRRHCVLSKLSNEPIVAKTGLKKYVFISGYPMTEKMFYVAFSKALFGSQVSLRPSQSRFLETSLGVLMSKTAVDLKGKDYFKAIRDGMGIKENGQETIESILSTVSDIENKLISLDQLPPQ